MKRTHKLRSLGDVAAVVAKAPSLSAAAKKLGVNRSTLHRWLEAGKVAKPAAKRGSAAAPEAPPTGQTPEEWAAAVRAAYPLTDTQNQLVDLARRALTIERDPESRSQERLAASGRFQQLVRQLNLDAEAPAGEQPRPRVVRRTGTGDPRAILMAVK